MKNKKTKYILIVVIAAALVAGIVTAGIFVAGNSDENGAAESAAATEIVTEIIKGTTENSNNGSDGKSSSDSENSSDSSSSNSSSGSSSKASESSGNSSSSSAENTVTHRGLWSESSGNSSSSSASSSSSSSSASSCAGQAENLPTQVDSPIAEKNKTTSSSVLTIDGNKYDVGEYFTCTIDITTPDKLMAYQADFEFDEEYIEIAALEMGSIAKPNSLPYYKDGVVSFNGSNIDTGYDFTEGGTMITMTFKVLKSGTTETSTNWVVAAQYSMSDTFDNYVENGSPTSDMNVKYIYS